jgi:preprotein translocase subunit YajC
MMRFIGLNLLLAQQTLLAADPAASDAAPPRMASNPAGDQIKFFMMMGVFALAMWFLLIAPQRKKAKELEATIKSLKPGDKIVTSSGILGVILTIKEKSLSIRSADTKLEILKSSVLEVIERSGEAGESKS